MIMKLSKLQFVFQNTLYRLDLVVISNISVNLFVEYHLNVHRISSIGPVEAKTMIIIVSWNKSMKILHDKV